MYFGAGRPADFTPAKLSVRLRGARRGNPSACCRAAAASMAAR